jgi:hypothetical protein
MSEGKNEKIKGKRKIKTIMLLLNLLLPRILFLKLISPHLLKVQVSYKLN